MSTRASTTKNSSQALVRRGGAKPTASPARRASLEEAVGPRGKKGAGKLQVVDPEDDDLDRVESQLPASTRKYSATPQLDASDVQMPKMKLTQPMTPEVGEGICQPGQFIVSNNEPAKELTVIPLVMGKMRILSDDNGIYCSSGDAIHGEGDPGGNCARCPHSQWTKGKKGGGDVKPACVFYYSYGVWVEEFQTLAIWNLKGSHIRAAQKLNSMIMDKNHGMGNFAIKVTPSDPIKGPKGHYWVPIIQLKKVDKKVLENARAGASSF